MVAYVKDSKGQLKTLKDLSMEYKVPLKLIQGRHQQGIKTIEDLIKPKWAAWDKE